MDYFFRPSGVSIPLFLKRKWERQQQKQKDVDADMGEGMERQASDEVNGDTSASNNEKSSPPARWEPKLRLRPEQELTRDQTHELSNRVFTASELEARIWKTTTAMFDIQRQLHRGEELYYEDTYNHGSIYKGWDAFVDMKDIGATSALGGGSAQTSSNRRVPADSRWFSTSCSSVSRTTPPAPFPPPLISQASLATGHLPAIPEQQERKETSTNDETGVPPKHAVTINATTPLPDTETAPAEASVETEDAIKADPSTSGASRTSQRSASAAATTTNPGTRNTESSETGSTRASSRPTTPTTKPDSGSTRKKRKSTTAGSAEEPPTKKVSQKSPGDEAGATASTPKPTTAVATRGSKAETNTSASKFEKTQGTSSVTDKPDKRETPAKRQKEKETPVPRKRGRPRRKS